MKKITVLITSIICIFASGCANMHKKANTAPAITPQPLTIISQIDSFRPEVACRQALEVVNGNPYGQEFFEKIFAKLVEQSKNSAAPENADLIWDNFVSPLNHTGKAPPDLVKKLWNSYFSAQFVSLPTVDSVEQCCHKLTDIKKNIEKEYRLKQKGFSACQQGNPDVHFLNAMYVYNTMWAVCHEVD